MTSPLTWQRRMRVRFDEAFLLASGIDAQVFLGVDAGVYGVFFNVRTARRHIRAHEQVEDVIFRTTLGHVLEIRSGGGQSAGCYRVGIDWRGLPVNPAR